MRDDSDKKSDKIPDTTNYRDLSCGRRDTRAVNHMNILVITNTDLTSPYLLLFHVLNYISSLMDLSISCLSCRVVSCLAVNPFI